MNRFYSLLLTAFLVAVTSWKVSAQVQFSISPKSQNATVNSQVSFAIQVKKFTDIEGYQFTYAFDPTKMEFIGFGPDVSNPTYLPTGGTTPGISAPLLAAGKITILWGTADGLPKSLPDNTTIMTLLFKSLISGTVAMGFSDSPLAPEVFGPGVDNLPSGTPAFTFDPLLNTIGGGGGNPCSPDVAPPVFGTCANINLTTPDACATANWTTPTATDACGSVTVSQISGPSSGACVPIGSTSVVYRATDAAGNTATCSFSVTVAKETTVNCTNTWAFPANIGNDLTLVMSEELVAKANDQVCVRVMVGNFNLIQGLSFSVNWNTANLQYLGIKDDKINFTGATVAANVNLLQKDNGKLGFFWDDQSGQGVTKSNGDVLFEICFKKIGVADAALSFSDSPTTISGAKEINGQSTDIAIINTRSGKVSICTGNNPVQCVQPTYDKLLNIKNVTISANGEVCVDVLVKNFSAIEGLQFAITWDVGRLQYQRTESGAAIVELGNNFAFISPNRLNFSLDWSANPLSVEDGKALFSICFQAVGGLGSTAAIAFTGNNEVTKNGVPQENVALGDGSVNIKTSPIVTAVNSGLCGGAGTVTANIASSGNYTFQWSGPGGNKTGKTVPVTAEGVYKVTVVDNATCLTGTAQTTVTASTAPTITSLVQNEIGLVINTSSSIVNWATAANPTTIVASGSTLNSPQPGLEYIATVGVGTCTVTKNILAIGVENTEPLAIKCAGNRDGKISLNISGAGASNLSYKWNPNGETSKDLANLGSGTYIVTITSSDNKVNTIRTFTLTAPTALAFSVAPVVKNAPNGSINIEVVGGTGTITYLWTGIGNVPSYTWPVPAPFTTSNTQDISGLEPGTYSVVVTDANGCSIFSTQKVDVQPIVVKLKGNSVTHSTCGQNNGAAELIIEGGSSVYSYIWNGPVQVGNSNVATNLSTGEYKITVTDQKYNLSTTYSIFINPSDGPIISVAQVTDAGDNCKGLIDISVTGGTSPYTYKWSGPTTGIPDVQDPTGLCDGSYTITLTDSKGCTAVKSDIIVARAARPCPIVNRLVQPNCSDSNDGIIELIVPGGKSPFSYKWSRNNAVIAASTKDLSNLPSGTYAVTITDAVGATCTRDNIQLNAKSALQVSVSTIDPVPNSARNGAATLSVNGGSGDYSYSWPNNVSTGSTASGLQAGSYTVTVTDNALGCKVLRTFQLGQGGTVEIVIRSIFNGTNIRCFGICNGIAEVRNVNDAVPPLRYQWSNGDTARIAKGLCVGVQRVTVTDSNNEKFEGAVTLIGPEKLTTTIVVDTNDKTAEAIVSGGTSPYFYKWQDDSSNPKILNVPVGRVFVNVTDANGCESFDDAYLGDPTNLDCLKATPVITPNGDSYNDEFEVFCLEKYIQNGKIYNTLEIFNRWGQQVFSEQNYENRSWLGLDSRGNPLPEGPYYYVIEVLLENGSYIKYKGSFSILIGE
ncbi:MAG: gliding motility-associated C-terminal domain-containing protein [Saprospiraceae bacterium]